MGTLNNLDIMREYVRDVASILYDIGDGKKFKLELISEHSLE
jgi:hypothetical protein